MTCVAPLRAHRYGDGSIRIVGAARHVEQPFFAYAGVVGGFDVPCGKCIGCRVARSEEWAVRCLHEAKMHEHSCFVTLTYDECCVPDKLVHRDWQLFMKRLRKARGKRIKFLMCGEYGDLNERPHFHACLFGVWFEDYVIQSVGGGKTLYTSEALSKLWPHGFSSFGQVSFASAAYVASYVVGGGKSGEYGRSSNRPGLGASFLEKFEDDVFVHDKCIVEAMGKKVPRYYDKLLKRRDPERLEELKEIRKEKSWEFDKSVDRLDARAEILRAKVSRKVRSL